MTWVGTSVATIGALLCLVAAIGLVRLPDPLSRLEVVTKASAGGLVLTLAGGVVLFPTPAVVVQSVLVAAFLLLVTPVSGHLVGRAIYRSGLTGPLRRDEAADGRHGADDESRPPRDTSRPPPDEP